MADTNAILWQKCILAKFHNRKKIQELRSNGWIPMVFGQVNKIKELITWMENNPEINDDQWTVIMGTKNTALILVNQVDIQLYISMVWKGKND